MGVCGLAPKNIVVDLLEAECSAENITIPSSNKAYDLRLAVAELKHISPHSVEIFLGSGSAKKLLAHNDLLLRWVSKGRISVTLKEPTVTFFTASADGSAKQHDAATGVCLATYQHPAPVNSLCLSKCGCFVYTACDDGTGRKFDDSNASVIRKYRSKGEALLHIAISPCAKYVYTCSRTSVTEKYNEATGQLLCVFLEHISGNPCLALSSCGAYIFKTTANNVAKKYNWQTGEVLATYGDDDSSVLSVALGHTGDETLVFAACSNGTVNQFDESGTCIKSYPCHSDKVTWIGCR